MQERFYQRQKMYLVTLTGKMRERFDKINFLKRQEIKDKIIHQAVIAAATVMMKYGVAKEDVPALLMDIADHPVSPKTFDMIGGHMLGGYKPRPDLIGIAD